jgi:hypothetical protein
MPLLTSDAVKNLRLNVQRFWRTYGDSFEEWWISLDPDARRQFLTDHYTTTCLLPEVSAAACRTRSATCRNFPKFVRACLRAEDHALYALRRRRSTVAAGWHR